MQTETCVIAHTRGEGGDVMAKNEKVEIIFKKMLEKSRASRLASCGQK